MNSSQDNVTADLPQNSLIANDELEDEELGLLFSTDNDSSTNLTNALSPIENLPIESLSPLEENAEV